MGSTIQNIKNLADWYATESQSDDSGHSAEVSKKSNTEIESVLSLGDLSLTTTDENLWYDGSKVRDDDGNYLIFRVSKKTSSYRKDTWQTESEKKQVQAFENLVSGVSNWYSFDSSDYFKENGYILDSFKVGNVLPFGVAYLTCEYEKVSGIRDNYYTYIPMPNYPHFIKNNNSYNLNNSWGFTNISKGCVVQWAYVNNDTHFGVIYRNKLKDTTSSTYYDNTVTYSVYLIEKTEQVMNWLGTNYHTEKGFIANSPIYGEGGVAQGLQGIVDTLSSDVNVPLKSNKGVTGTGFVNIYEISTNQLTDFGKDMFSDVDLDFDYDASEDITETQSQYGDFSLANDSLANMANITHGFKNIFSLISSAIKNYFSSKLVNYVLSVHIIPVSPTTSASAERINVGYKTFTQTAKRVTSDYIDYDCGTLTIPSKYKNFLDFTQTKAKIYLPFIGMVDISPQYFYDCTIGLKYRFSVIDGTCVAFLTSTKMSGNTSLIGTYNGSCCLHIPFTGENYANMITGVIQGVGGVVSGVATANPMLAVGGAMQGASSIAEGMSGTLLGSPQSSSSASFMGVRTPYIIIERPIPQLPPTYFTDGGAVAMITEKIGNCEGFTKCKNVHCSISTHKSINDKITQILETGFHA